ncbi:uncharacterized protein LOC132571962 [Heteronotia binoei]|uniref:uncharacterized protein LOC132571962 n=1 Tax=Heteronotia binoei TaxID=13085 RepID=UPI00292FFC58|nr:uncharacterized protein LOC132571962 [Heteronotia binoei]
MKRWASLWLWATWSCAALVLGRESGRALCGGLDSCSNVFTLEVYRGESQSLNLSLNPNWQKLVKKCDPESKTWKEEILAVHGNANPLADKTTSIFLNRNFTVRNAGKKEEGLYKIERLLDNSCLAVVIVVVIDPPLSMTVIPYFDVSSTVFSKVTETPEASPLGTDYTTLCVAVFVPLCILAIGAICIIHKLAKKKSKCRSNVATSEVDPEQLLNGSLPPPLLHLTASPVLPSVII